MKLAVGEFGPWTFRSVCIYAGAAGLFAIAALRGAPMALPRDRFAPLVVVAMLNIAVWQVASAFALTLLPAGRGALVAFTMPLWAAVLGAVFLGERFTVRKSAALALGLVGLGLLAMPAGDALAASPAGLALMLLAAVAWGGGTVALKRMRFGLPVVSLTAWQLAVAGVPVVAGMIAFEMFGPPGAILPAGDVSFAGVAGAVYAATIPMVFCHWAWFRALDILPASVASIGTLAVPVVGVLSSAWLLGEALGWAELSALGCIVAALALALFAPKGN
jgi:drug/metabolite transporter (DMT)-like permease